MKTELEVKNKIMKNVKALVSKNEEKSAKAFLYLVRTFYKDANAILDDEDRYYLDNYQIILAMLLKLQQGLIEEEDYDNIAIIVTVKFQLQNEFVELLEDEDEILEFNLSNDFYNTQLNNILKTKLN